jgi:hypothetical protein
MTDRLPETIFVIAGNMDQFRTFRKQLTETIASEGLFKLSHTDIIYVGGLDALRGHRSPWGYTVGTWRARPDIGTISTFLQERGSSIDEFIEVSL